MVDRFLERVKAHGRGGVQTKCFVNCGECCRDNGEACRYLMPDGCSLPVEERPRVCNEYLCPDQVDWATSEAEERGIPVNPAPFPPPDHRIGVRAAMARWEEHRVRDVPEGCPPGSTFGSSYLTNIRDYGERSVWEMPKFEKVFVIGGAPVVHDPYFFVDAMAGIFPTCILGTRDHLNGYYQAISDVDMTRVFVVFGELDMLGCYRDYPPGYNRGLICDPCKLLDPRIPFGDVRFCRLPPMQREDTFTKPQWLGREIPYRTSGELALYISLYVLKAPVVGVLGIENEGPDRHAIYDNARNLLEGGHSSEVIDYSGRGVVHDYLEGKK